MTQINKYRPTSPKQAARRAGRIDQALDVELFKALSDPTRVRLLACLAKCGRVCSVTEVAECCSVDFSVVSRHLAMLADAGVLESDKQGRTVFYQVRYERLGAALRREPMRSTNAVRTVRVVNVAPRARVNANPSAVVQFFRAGRFANRFHSPPSSGESRTHDAGGEGAAVACTMQRAPSPPRPRPAADPPADGRVKITGGRDVLEKLQKLNSPKVNL